MNQSSTSRNPFTSVLVTLMVVFGVLLGAACATDDAPADVAASSPLEADTALADDVDAVYADEAYDVEAYTDAFTAGDEASATRTGPTCGGIVCPRGQNLCCNNRCFRRTPGKRCVADRNDGSSE